MNVHMRKISYYLYQHTGIFKTFQLPHTYIYIYFLKEYIYACSRYCVKIAHVHILSILLLQTTYAHLEYFINIYIFVVSYLFIYAHWRAKLMSCTHLHLFEKELSCHLSTLERQFHIIYSFGKHSRAIFDMGTFFERLLMLPIHKYTYFERHFYATYPTYIDF